ncbi:MAG: hypothetical protein K1W26_05100, partial [Acetatifactor sp.]
TSCKSGSTGPLPYWNQDFELVSQLPKTDTLSRNIVPQKFEFFPNSVINIPLLSGQVNEKLPPGSGPVT